MSCATENYVRVTQSRHKKNRSHFESLGERALVSLAIAKKGRKKIFSFDEKSWCCKLVFTVPQIYSFINL